MPAHHFTAADLRACATGFLLFPLYGFVPGYVAAWLLDLFSFRRRTVPFRAALSIPLSISVCPITVYLVSRFVSMTAVAWMFGTLWLAFAVIVAREPRRTFGGFGRAIPLLAAAWILVALLSLVDMQLGDRLYYNNITFDYCVRTEMIHSLATTGIPPRTPFFYPGHDVPLRYHYFWLILCSLVERLAGRTVSARQALIAGTPWCGLALMGLIALYLRLFSPHGPSRLQRRTAIGIALLGVTGLDLLPSLLMLVSRAAGESGMVFPSVEWWNEQVDGWIYTMLWEPHHLAGVVCCLTGFLILWQAPAEQGRRGLLKNGALAGVAFATAAGSSIHVVFVFAVFLAVWMAIAVAKKWRGDVIAGLIAGATAVPLALPYLATLAGKGAGSGGPLLQWTVRTFMMPEMLMHAAGMRMWQIRLADLLLLPINYGMELGIFFAVGWWRWKTWRAKSYKLERQDLAAVAMIGVSVTICTFLRSSLIGNNDLGWRGFLPAQFGLLLWSADLLADWPRVPRRSLLASLVVLGAAGTAYDVALLRFYPLLSDHGLLPTIIWEGPDRQFGRRTYAVREAYEWSRSNTPPKGVVQYEPMRGQDTAAQYYAERQAMVADIWCSTVFGGDAAECAPLVENVKGLFAAGAGEADFEKVCATQPIDLLVTKDIDPVWGNRQSWVWRRQPAFANDYVRVFRCRESAKQGN
jgi:hypothetical protein